MRLKAALRSVNAAARRGEIAFAYHAAEEKMPEFDLFEGDVLHALSYADDGVLDDGDGAKWKFYGPIGDGARIAVVVRFRKSKPPLVVTVHPVP